MGIVWCWAAMWQQEQGILWLQHLSPTASITGEMQDSAGDGKVAVPALSLTELLWLWCDQHRFECSWVLPGYSFSSH